MSAIARERRRRRASRLHAIMSGSNGMTWRSVVVIGMSTRDSHDARGLNAATRSLAEAGWDTAQRDEDDRRVVVAARELPVTDRDDHPQGAAVAFLDALQELCIATPELTAGAHWLDDVILIPPGAVDSDDDLLWLDPGNTLAAAWQQPDTAPLIAACQALCRHWSAQDVPDASGPQSLADDLF